MVGGLIPCHWDAHSSVSRPYLRCKDTCKCNLHMAGIGITNWNTTASVHNHNHNHDYKCAAIASHVCTNASVCCFHICLSCAIPCQMYRSSSRPLHMYTVFPAFLFLFSSLVWFPGGDKQCPSVISYTDDVPCPSPLPSSDLFNHVCNL